MMEIVLRALGQRLLSDEHLLAIENITHHYFTTLTLKQTATLMPIPLIIKIVYFKRVENISGSSQFIYL
jgi:hypothetical protein